METNMKKSFLCFIGSLFSTIFTSCLWIPKSNLEYINKRSFKAFNALNNSLVITLKVSEDFSLFGNDNLDESSKLIGCINLVYDWENDEITDYMFWGETNGRQGPFKMIKTSDGNIMFCQVVDNGKRFYLLNASDTEDSGFEIKTITKKEAPGYRDGIFFDTVYPDVRKAAFLYKKNYNYVREDNKKYTIRLYNPETKQFEEIDFQSSSPFSSITYQTDMEGNYWLGYNEDNDEFRTNPTTSFRKLDITANILEEPLISLKAQNTNPDYFEGYTYKLEYVDSDCLLIEKIKYENEKRKTSLLYVSRNDGSTIQIPETDYILPSDTKKEDLDEEYSNIIRANGKIYCFQKLTEEIKFIRNYTWRILEFDSVNKSLKELLYKTDLNISDFNSVMARDSKIFFTYNNNSDILLYCYDCNENIFDLTRTFNAADFINGLK